ncbi:Hypothetical predicted protein, partial [Mytilus galloprovincialis]
MAQYSAIDESCDSSALLGMIINMSTFPTGVQTDSTKCMGQFVKDIRLSNKEENRILCELNTWATNGHNFLSGTVLGLEIVEEIRQQTHVLSEYVQALCSETYSQFISVQKELKDLENSLQERIRNLES